jgi:hypothetical protein
MPSVFAALRVAFFCFPHRIGASLLVLLINPFKQNQSRNVAANARRKRSARWNHVSVSSIQRHKNNTTRGAYSIRQAEGVATRFSRPTVSWSTRACFVIAAPVFSRPNESPRLRGSSASKGGAEAIGAFLDSDFPERWSLLPNPTPQKLQIAQPTSRIATMINGGHYPRSALVLLLHLGVLTAAAYDLAVDVRSLAFRRRQTQAVERQKDWCHHTCGGPLRGTGPALLTGSTGVLLLNGKLDVSNRAGAVRLSSPGMGTDIPLRQRH